VNNHVNIYAGYFYSIGHVKWTRDENLNNRPKNSGSSRIIKLIQMKIGWGVKQKEWQVLKLLIIRGNGYIVVEETIVLLDQQLVIE